MASRARRLVSAKRASIRPSLTGDVTAIAVASNGAREAHREHRWGAVRLCVDLLLLAGAALLVDALWSDDSSMGTAVVWPALLGAGILGLSYIRRAYARRLTLDIVDDVGSTAAVTCLALGVVVTAQVLVEGGAGADVVDTVRFGAVAAAALAGGRAAVDLFQSRARRHGSDLIPTLIVGAGNVGRRTARRLVKHPELGLRPIGFLDKEPLDNMDEATGLPVLGASWDLDQVVEDHGVGHVIVTFSKAPTDVLLRIVNTCERRGISVALVPRLFEKVTQRLTIDHLGGLPLVTSHPTDPRGWQFAVKYALDRVTAFFLLCLLLPLMVICAVAVWMSLGRPILFRQRRVGCDGREFDMLKFRSLRLGSAHREETLDLPDEDTAPGGVEGEGRVTRLGAILRNTSLDELPQLFNVLKGQMSIVGPRPERPEFVDLFEPRVYRYYDRQRVKAGITGWAQVNGLRGRTSLSDRVEWDNYYIENFSLWLDLKIIGKTIVTLPRHSRTCR
jgi:exopolysaccharide biosynthesis polyprenyl glycosylphosphotransferase